MTRFTDGPSHALVITDRPLTAHGLGFTLIITVLAAWICTHLGA